MSRGKDTTPKQGAGRSPTFQIRITPELREQIDIEAIRDGLSLGNWFKELARQELKRRGIEPKG
jgi:predicted HicB family RNase H-like nuclease